MQNKQLYGVMIPRQKLIALSSGVNNEISTHSLSQWLKVETEDQYTILPRDFVIALMDIAEISLTAQQLRSLNSNWSFEDIRGNWL